MIYLACIALGVVIGFGIACRLFVVMQDDLRNIFNQSSKD
jgi:hypothetical protein